MKTEIHPEYVECRVTCSCGNQFTTRATVGELRVELCAECHPFYTGKQKLVDTGGRVERFTRRYAQAQGTGKGSKGEAPPAGGETAAEAKKPKRKKRVTEAPKSKPPVSTKGGPRPKFEPRAPRGEGRGREGRGEGRGREGRGDRARAGKAPPATEETSPATEQPATESPATEQSEGGQSEE